jgi:hypothetical protein
MSRNTHCQALLQQNKHNEQQSHIHVMLRNLGNQPGKTPMWGNPKRERFISFRKVLSATTYNFYQGKNSLTTPKTIPNFLLRESCQNRTVVRPPLIVLLYNLEFVPSSLLYRLYGSVQYDLQQQQITQQLHTENHLGKCVQSPLGNAPSLLSFPLLLKAFSEISQSLLLIVLHTTQCILL